MEKKEEEFRKTAKDRAVSEIRALRMKQNPTLRQRRRRRRRRCTRDSLARET